MAQNRKIVKSCRLQGKCGGCRYLNMPYDEQLKKKQSEIKKILGKFGETEQIIGMDNPYYYRNKVHHAFTRDRSGNIISGPYEANSHWVLNCENCFIEDKKCQEIIHEIRGLIKKFKIRTYDEDKDYGVLRHVLVRRGFETGEIMVVLVIGSDFLPYAKDFTRTLVRNKPEITTVVLNYNSKKTSMILGEKESVLYGPGFIYDVLCGKRFRISSKSFYQVNPVQTEKLYNAAIDFAGLNANDTVIDAYCGIGTIAVCASDKAGKVIGAELNKNAVRDAKINAKDNKVQNTEFYSEDAGSFMQKMAAKGRRADVVFMDPPRNGSTVKFMTALIKMKPRKIVYISCEPTSLARDLKYLTSNGYKCERIKPVDMFPNTVHVETVCLLSKLHEAKHHVNVTVDMDELDVTSAESKATYEEIKQYVAEHNAGMKVSSLYIAQVKQKYGIIERENYNKSKSENTKPSQCPRKKEEAIVEALKHFGMVQ